MKIIEMKTFFSGSAPIKVCWEYHQNGFFGKLISLAERFNRNGKIVETRFYF